MQVGILLRLVKCDVWNRVYEGENNKDYNGMAKQTGQVKL